MPHDPHLTRMAAGVILGGFAGHRPPGEFAALIEAGLGGAILFSRNIPGPEAVRGLTDALRAQAGRPFFVAIDQEGGRVQRLKAPFPQVPAMAALGAANDLAVTRAWGALLGQGVASLGIDIDFAPVGDVFTNPANTVIGDRAFGTTPALVSAHAGALAQGILDGGALPCAKHFPGHGDTHADSHLELPRVTHSLARLRTIEWPPFAAAAAQGVPMIMTAHVVAEAIDSGRPATLSPAVSGNLRGELGFQGVIVSDDLEMQAIAAHWPVDIAAGLAIEAGCDLLLICSSAEWQRRAIAHLAARAAADAAFRRRLENAHERIQALWTRKAYGYPPPEAWRSLLPPSKALAASGHDPTERA